MFCIISTPLQTKFTNSSDHDKLACKSIRVMNKSKTIIAKVKEKLLSDVDYLRRASTLHYVFRSFAASY